MWTGSEGRLAFPYQRIGMVNALQELSNATEGKYLNSLSLTICKFLLSCYKDEGCLLCSDLLAALIFSENLFLYTLVGIVILQQILHSEIASAFCILLSWYHFNLIAICLHFFFLGNEEVKLAILSAVASWAKRSADIIQSDLLSFFASGLKEKEALRRGHLRCLRVICTNTDAVLQVSQFFGSLLYCLGCYLDGLNKITYMHTSGIILAWASHSACQNWFY